LESSYITLVEHGVNGLVHCGRVSDAHVLALAVGATFYLEGPYEEANWLGCSGGSILAVHHGLDGRVARFSEEGEHVLVSMALKTVTVPLC
jgi:hypothetical protein